MTRTMYAVVDAVGICFQPEDGYRFTDKGAMVDEMIEEMLNVERFEILQSRNYVWVLFTADRNEIGSVKEEAWRIATKYIEEVMSDDEISEAV